MQYNDTVSLAQHIIGEPISPILGITFASGSLLRSYGSTYIPWYTGPNHMQFAPHFFSGSMLFCGTVTSPVRPVLDSRSSFACCFLPNFCASLKHCLEGRGWAAICLVRFEWKFNSFLCFLRQAGHFSRLWDCQLDLLQTAGKATHVSCF